MVLNGVKKGRVMGGPKVAPGGHRVSDQAGLDRTNDSCDDEAMDRNDRHEVRSRRGRMWPAAKRESLSSGR